MLVTDNNPKGDYEESERIAARIEAAIGDKEAECIDFGVEECIGFNVAAFKRADESDKPEDLIPMGDMQTSALISIVETISAEIDRRVDGELASLQAWKDKRAGAVVTAEPVADEAPATTDELAPRRTRTPGVAKYRSTANPVLTWTGRGKQPKWIVDHIAAGGTLDELLIPVEAAA